MARFPLILLSVLVPASLLGQTRDDKAAPPPPPPPITALQGGFNGQMANSRAAEWKAANAAKPGDAAMQLNWLRSEQNAMEANNNGTLRAADKAKLAGMAEAIANTSPNSFEAHMAAFYTAFPAASAFQDLAAAYQLTPDREELAAPMLSKAMLEGDAAGLRRWSAELVRRDAIAAPLQVAAADVLRCLPEKAVLFTNGDMDTQPAVVDQVQHGDKPGVLIVDRRLLGNLAYRNRVWQQAGGVGAVPPGGPAFAQALLEANHRPIYFALSLDRSWLEAFPGQLHAVGAAFRVGTFDANDAAALAGNWSAMKKPLDAGPLSRNYLLPGAILLQHYRQQGNKAKAAALEAELRKISAATGGTQDLKQANVLKP